jgi:hypothetical protein
MAEGITVGLRLTPGLPEEGFVAEAIGNLVVYRVEKERKEGLQWQVLRIVGSGDHHYRLVVRHPERSLDLGLSRTVEKEILELSSLSLEQLREEFSRAQSEGLKAVPLRVLHETPDFWSDNFWEYFY